MRHTFKEERRASAQHAVRLVCDRQGAAPFGGLGSMVAQVVGENCPKFVKNLSLPDAPVITGTSKEVFDYYGLNSAGIAQSAKVLLTRTEKGQNA